MRRYLACYGPEVLARDLLLALLRQPLASRRVVVERERAAREDVLPRLLWRLNGADRLVRIDKAELTLHFAQHEPLGVLRW